MTSPRAPLGRLSLMMFLEYAVWGAWLPVAARFLSAPAESGGLGFSPGQIGMILGVAASAGAILAPFIAGQLADRLMNAERALAGLLLLGGTVNWMLASQTSYSAWLWLSIVYSVLFMPTLALTNSVAFAHVGDAGRDFPRVRVWGTIGWIAASWAFPMIYLQKDLAPQAMPPFLSGTEVEGATARLAEALRFSGLLSLLLGLYCLSLPATPPRRGAAESLAFAKAFALFLRPPLAWLLLAGLAVASIHQIYFLQAGPYLSFIGLKDSEIGPAMTVGQFSEIAIIAGLGLLLARLPFRIVLSLGALAYFVRYWIWSHPDWPISVLVASQVLHGVCYACFFATAYIYVDRSVPRDVRHSAQTVFGIVMLGGGPVIGGQLSGYLAQRFAEPGVPGAEFAPLWSTLSWAGLAVAVLLLAVFRDAPAHGDSSDRP